MPADTILHKAAHTGDMNQVKKIVEEGKIDGKFLFIDHVTLYMTRKHKFENES